MKTFLYLDVNHCFTINLLKAEERTLFVFEAVIVIQVDCISILKQ